ncbi:hypothetical protein VTN96DRAFT_3404 [Rasamsonia emersonii]
MTPAKGETQQAKTGFFTTTKQQHGGEFHLLFALQLAIIIHSGACAGRVREHPDQCALPIHRGGLNSDPGIWNMEAVLWVPGYRPDRADPGGLSSLETEGRHDDMNEEGFTRRMGVLGRSVSAFGETIQIRSTPSTRIGEASTLLKLKTWWELSYYGVPWP